MVKFQLHIQIVKQGASSQFNCADGLFMDADGLPLAFRLFKGHFVAVAESNDPIYAVVVVPKMDATQMFGLFFICQTS